MTELQKRLMKELHEHEITIVDLADYLELSVVETIRLLTRKDYELSLTIYTKLCNLFGEAYLIGITNESEYERRVK